MNPRFNPQNLKYKLCIWPNKELEHNQVAHFIFSWALGWLQLSTILHLSLHAALLMLSTWQQVIIFVLWRQEKLSKRHRRTQRPKQIRPLSTLELNEKKCVNILKCSCGSTGSNSGWLAVAVEHVVQDVDRPPSSNSRCYSEALWAGLEMIWLSM